MNGIIPWFVSNNRIPVSSMYALLILFFWNSRLPSDGNIIKNVHQPLNNKLYFGKNIKNANVVMA